MAVLLDQAHDREVEREELEHVLRAGPLPERVLLRGLAARHRPIRVVRRQLELVEQDPSHLLRRRQVEPLAGDLVDLLLESLPLREELLALPL